MIKSLQKDRITSFSILVPSFLLCFSFVIWSITYQFREGHEWWVSAILSSKLIVELIAIFYMICFLLSSLFYLYQKKNKGLSRITILQRPPVAVLYFCCRDLDYMALLSLVNLTYPGKLIIPTGLLRGFWGYSEPTSYTNDVCAHCVNQGLLPSQ
jgi:hypothetical protein